MKKDKPFMGFKKISKQLNYSYGINISTRQVKKILKKHGLEKTDYPEPKKHKPKRFERLSRNEKCQFHSWKGESRFRKLMDNMGID